MPIFTIEKVTTEFSRERRAGAVCGSRTLDIEGPSAEGGRIRARLVFGDKSPAAAVGYLTRRAGVGVSLVGWLPATTFAGFLDALAGGGPIQVHCETREGQAGYLRRLGLGRAGRALAAAVARRPGGSTAAGFAMPH